MQDALTTVNDHEAKEALSLMTQPIGRHFLIGLRPYPDLHPSDARLLTALQPSGVVVFRDNFDPDLTYPRWHARFCDLLAAVAACLDRDRFIVGMDHEGGLIVRPPPPITPFDYAATWGDDTAAVGAAMARELSSLGVNVGFAPSLDVHSNPENTVIGPRAFGRTPDVAARRALAFAHAQSAGGIVVCGKHFPGHGDTTEDSHYALPTLDVDRAVLAARELVPFQAAVAARLPMLMTAHLRVPSLDTRTPVTLSVPAVRGLLREEMHYDGVVVTDDLGMHAMDDWLSDPRSAADVLAAGHDLLLICSYWTDTERARGFADALATAARGKAFANEILAPSAARLEGLLRTLPRRTPHLLDEATFRAHRALAPLSNRRRAAVV